jgi:hypothetical protein
MSRVPAAWGFAAEGSAALLACSETGYDDVSPADTQRPRVAPGGMPLGATQQAEGRARVGQVMTQKIISLFHGTEPSGVLSADGLSVAYRSIGSKTFIFPLPMTAMTPQIELAELLVPNTTTGGPPSVSTAVAKLVVQAAQAAGSLPAHIVPLLGSRQADPPGTPAAEGAPAAGSVAKIGESFYYPKQRKGANSDWSWGVVLRCAHNAPGLPFRK